MSPKCKYAPKHAAANTFSAGPRVALCDVLGLPVPGSMRSFNDGTGRDSWVNRSALGANKTPCPSPDWTGGTEGKLNDWGVLPQSSAATGLLKKMATLTETDSSPCWQKLATGIWRQPYEFVQSGTLNLPNIRFNITLPSTTISPKWSLSLKFPTKIQYEFVTSPMRAACRTQFNLIEVMALSTLD
jgi:hypothetical protein